MNIFARILARHYKFKPFLPTVAFSQPSSNICCPKDCVSRHNGGTSGAPLKPLGDDSALRTLSSLRGLRGTPEVPPLCRETQSLGQQMLELGCENATVGIVATFHCCLQQSADFILSPLQFPPHPLQTYN